MSIKIWKPDLVRVGYPYVRVCSVQYDRAAPGRPSYTGDRSTSPRCRICRDERGAVTFREIAHVVSEGLGNRELRTLEECDACNQELGDTVENDLLKFLGPARALSPRPSRPGGVKLKHRKKGSYIASSPGRLPPIEVGLVEGDSTLGFEPGAPRTVELAIRAQSYNPMNICRGLATMAYRILPRRQLSGLEHIRNWIRGRSSGASRMRIVNVPGPGVRFSVLSVWQPELPLIGGPTHVVTYNFDNRIYILEYPNRRMEPARIPAWLVLPISPFPPHRPSIEERIISRDSTVSPPAQRFTFGFERMVPVDPMKWEGPLSI